MKERELARVVRSTLDESAERLPYRTAHRLAAARAAALARARTVESPFVAHDALRIGSEPQAEFAGAPPPRLAWRIAAVVLPIVVVTAALFGISVLDTQQRAEDLADLDAGMLADEVPITAYADRGFGVYLRNVSWQSEAEE